MERKTAQEKAKALVAQMTLEEKAAQLHFAAPAIPRLGVPAYNWWNEALHGVARAGVATVFPQAIGLAATFDTALMARVGDAIAMEGRAKYNAAVRHNDRDLYKGLTFWAPNINIFRDPRWGRGHETYGEDPCLTARMGVAFVQGMQGDGPVMKAAACAKHLAVHSGPEADRHAFNAIASKKDMAETYLPAFEALVKEGKVEAVMGAYNRLNGEPCCASPTLQKILRRDWGFAGHFVSDCWALNDFHAFHHITKNADESAALAISNGCDLNCGCVYDHLVQAVEQGMATEADVTAAAQRVFTTRYLLGLMDGSAYDQVPYSEVDSPAHQALAQEAACKSMVLLKNDGLLPLDKKKIQTLAVIGPNADSRACLLGNYHGTPSRYVTVREGVEDFLGQDARVLYAQGSHLFRDNVENLAYTEDRISEALAVAEESDVVVLCLGLDETLEGEQGDAGNADASGDKKDLCLPKCQRILLQRLAACGKPLVLVLLAGSAIDLSFAQAHCGAILQAWYPGGRGGRAVAQVLFGQQAPSGKLPVTFYRDLQGLPDFSDYRMQGRTYRYLQREPLYPFGYGLTYGSAQVAAARLLAQPSEGADLPVEVTVQNTGARDVEEVVQLYLKDRESPLAVPNHSLCAFGRVQAPAGQRVTLQLSVPWRAFLAVDEAGERRLDSRRFTLYVGTSQPDARSAALGAPRPVEVEIQLCTRSK